MYYKNLFDVIVVYSEDVAHSASDSKYKEYSPFSEEYSDGVNIKPYEYFLESCKNQGISAAFSTSKDITGYGKFSSYWKFDKKWKRYSKTASSVLLFDKFTPHDRIQRNNLNLLLSHPLIETFTSTHVKKLLNDKLTTYKEFKPLAIPTVSVGLITQLNLTKALKKLDTLIKNHKNKQDFNKDFIIKDRHGSGGINVYKFSRSDSYDTIEKKIQEDNESIYPTEYIVQPFIACDKGFNFFDYTGFMDLRMIVLNNKVIYSFIRIAKKDDFRANLHQGGKLVVIPKELYPQDVLECVRKINKKLNVSNQLYALDFIKSNSGTIYFIEGNPTPGIIWDEIDLTNIKLEKLFIRNIVKELRNRISLQKS